MSKEFECLGFERLSAGLYRASIRVLDDDSWYYLRQASDNQEEFVINLDCTTVDGTFLQNLWVKCIIISSSKNYEWVPVELIGYNHIPVKSF